MEELKAYYKTQTETQPEASLTPKPAHARKRRPVRGAVLIAALAVFLTVSALAAVQIGKTFVRTNEEGTSFVSPVEKVPMSEALRKFIADDANKPEEKTPEEEGYETYSLEFQSLAEAADFFDIRLAGNTLLTNAGLNPYDGGAKIKSLVFNNNDDSGVVYLMSHYDIGNGGGVFYQIHFSYGESGEAAEHELWSMELEAAEPYISRKNGIEAQISSQNAAFCRDNLVYYIAADNPGALKEIIDAFE